MKVSTLLFFVALLLLLGTSFWLFRPDAPAPQMDSERVDLVPAAAPVKQQVTRIRIAAGRRIEGPAIVRVQQGDTLRLEFTADSDAELHLHGYDLHLPLSADGEAVLQFRADVSGRFEYELHGHHAGHHSLGVIEVMPR